MGDAGCESGVKTSEPVTVAALRPPDVAVLGFSFGAAAALVVPSHTHVGER